MKNQPENTANLEKVKEIRNTSVLFSENKSTGRVIETIKTSFNHIKSLNNHNISINTLNYTQLGPSGQDEIKTARDKDFIRFESGIRESRPGDSKYLRFNLPKEEKDYRVELAHRNQFGMNTDSSYEFQMQVDQAARSAIFFQVKETGGNMKNSEGSRPPVSLTVKNNNEIFVSINTDSGNVLRKKIAVLENPQDWNKFKIRIVWNRENPLVNISIDGNNVFEYTKPFGAHNSVYHYSKFGVYIPQQKSQEGIRDTSLLFDNFRESHREFKSPDNSSGNSGIRS